QVACPDRCSNTRAADLNPPAVDFGVDCYPSFRITHRSNVWHITISGRAAIVGDIVGLLIRGDLPIGAHTAAGGTEVHRQKVPDLFTAVDRARCGVERRTTNAGDIRL